MRNAFFKALLEEARKDPRIILLTGDLGYGCADAFARTLPKQFMNMGVSEGNMVGAAAGMAFSGLIPFAYSIATFLSMRPLEHIRNDICCHQANVKLIGVGGGFSYGLHGPTHHALEDIALLRSLSSMTVLAPADPTEVRLAVRAMIQMEGPCYLRLGRVGEPVLHLTQPDFRIGKGIVIREGKEAALLATGGMVRSALEAADILAQNGIQPTVASVHTIKPLDQELILRLARTNQRIVTIEDHSITGGLGGAVSEVLAEAGIPGVKLKRLGIPDSFRYPAGDASYLRDLCSLSPEKIAEAIRTFN